MPNEEIIVKLNTISNLLALQLIKNISKEEASCVLKQAGMTNSDIGTVLGISSSAVAAHHSNRKKQTNVKSIRKTKD
jgi:predicted transcriptional regulator